MPNVEAAHGPPEVGANRDRVHPLPDTKAGEGMRQSIALRTRNLVGRRRFSHFTRFSWIKPRRCPILTPLVRLSHPTISPAAGRSTSRGVTTTRSASLERTCKASGDSWTGGTRSAAEDPCGWCCKVSRGIRLNPHAAVCIPASSIRGLWLTIRSPTVHADCCTGDRGRSTTQPFAILFTH